MSKKYKITTKCADCGFINSFKTDCMDLKTGQSCDMHSCGNKQIKCDECWSTIIKVEC